MFLSPNFLRYSLPPATTNPRHSFPSPARISSAAMKDLPVRQGTYCVPQRRLASVIVAASHADAAVSTCGGSAAAQVGFDWPDRRNGTVAVQRNDPCPMLLDQQSLQSGKWGSDYYSEDDSDREMEPSMNKGSSTVDINDWKWKLNTLLRKKDEQEIVSRERKDRRDFEQIAALATKMNLYSHNYGRVIVVSKVPLPNYRSDLDEKRPQREVIIPAHLQRKVDVLLEAHLSQRPIKNENHPDANFSRSSSNASIATDEGLFEPPEPYSVVMEKLMKRKSSQLRDQQRDWQESPEGRKMLKFRRSLPSYKERDAILASISKNQVVVFSGETGCGKTTQIPQYILESEIEAARGAVCSIICTQPRRISAMAVSERVAAERGEKLGESVGYKVRLEGMKGKDTRLLFCTTGVLLRRLLVDRNLKGVTHVIVDEIHERGMNEDFLLIVLKELLPRRPELRLVLMSATLNAELFSSYFGGAPMINIQGFTYPVQTHFLEDVLEITGYRLTPYNQTDDYGQEKSWKMQKQALRKRKSQIASVVEDALEAADFKDYNQSTRESLSYWNPDALGFNLIEAVLLCICKQERPGAVLVFMTGWDDISALKDQLQANPLLGDPTKVLLLACHGSMASSEQAKGLEPYYNTVIIKLSDPPERAIWDMVCVASQFLQATLYRQKVDFSFYYCLANINFLDDDLLRRKKGSSLLASQKEVIQRLIFDEPEDGVRKIVLATNIAETSITINDVVFVVDCGKAKETSYDALNNTPCLLPSWISKASSRQRQGRAGRVQAGECFRLYPRCVYDAFAEFQLPELLRTPLQSLCLQIKSLQLGSISEFLSRALQSPEPLSVQNAVEYLKIIGALDEKENLTALGRFLSTLPVEPKLGKMLVLGAIFNCLDPILTVVSGLSVRDPFLMPLDKKDLAEYAKSQFSAQEYSDHLALIRAYEGWKEAEREQNGYDFCWKNFLSLQTMKAMDSLRKQFLTVLADTGLIDDFSGAHNIWSHDKHLIRAIICAGLYPGISSILKKEKPISLKTMEDGQVMLCSSSVNAREQTIPYPWLVFNEKVKVNSVFIRDSTGVSDSVLILFGGEISHGVFDGHLKMLGGYLEFFMRPALADMYLNLKKELQEIIQNKLLDPKIDINSSEQLLSAVRLLISEDPCDGRFFFGRQMITSQHVRTRPELVRPEIRRTEVRPSMKPFVKFSKNGDGSGDGPGGDNSKSQLQTLLTRAGHEAPKYNTTQLMNGQFRTTVEFNGMQFVGQPCHNKKLAEKDAAAAALQWLASGITPCRDEIDNLSTMLKKSKNKQHRRF